MPKEPRADIPQDDGDDYSTLMYQQEGGALSNSRRQGYKAPPGRATNSAVER